MLKGSFDYSKAYISLELSRLFLFKGRTFIFFGFFLGGGQNQPPLLPPHAPLLFAAVFLFLFAGENACLTEQIKVSKRGCLHPSCLKEMGFVPFPSHIKEGTPGGNKP